MEDPFVIIPFSKRLNHCVKGWANIIAAVITIVFVISRVKYPHYLFTAVVEVFFYADNFLVILELTKKGGTELVNKA